MLPLDICSTPPLLRRLLYNRQEEESRHFQEHICQYNSSLAFTSLGATRDPKFDRTHGNYVFKFSGEVWHWHGALMPEPEAQSSYVQIYFLESAAAAAAAAQLQCPANFPLRQSLLLDLHDMVTEVSPFVTLYKTAHERLLTEGADQHDVSLCLHFSQHTDQWHYNLPTTSTEVAAIPPYAHPRVNTQDIMLHLQNPPDGQFPLQCIHDYNPAYDALHYALLFPLGDLGWHDQLPLHHARGEGKLTQNEDYSYQLHEPTDEAPMLLQGGNSSSNLLWMHGHALSSLGYHDSDITKESFMLPNSMGLWMLPMLGIILVMLASPSFCLQATLEVHRACFNFARIHILLLLPLCPSQTFLLLQLPTLVGGYSGGSTPWANLEWSPRYCYTCVPSQNGGPLGWDHQEGCHILGKGSG